MQQGVHAADVHEGAVIGEAADRALNGFAFLDFGVAALLDGALLILQDGAAVHHHVFVGHVELDDADADLLPEQLLQLGGVPGAAARGGHEGAHAHVHAQAALDDAR